MRFRKIIYGDPLDDWYTKKSQGTIFSFFYLHREANDINGNDICNANAEVFHWALNIHPFLSKLKLQDGNTYDGIVIPWLEMGRVQGLVCLCSDIEGIRHALFEYHLNRKKINTLLEESEKKWIEKKYPKILELFRDYDNLKND